MAVTQTSFINNAYSKIRQTILVALGYTPENVANKTGTITGVSDTLYPSEKAVADYVGSFQPKLTYDVEIGAFILEWDEDYES